MAGPLGMPTDAVAGELLVPEVEFLGLWDKTEGSVVAVIEEIANQKFLQKCLILECLSVRLSFSDQVSDTCED